MAASNAHDSRDKGLAPSTRQAIQAAIASALAIAAGELVSPLIALLYGLFGFFQPQLLVLRLEETAVGAAAGILVSVLLLPTSTRLRVSNNSREFLMMPASVVEDCGERLLEGRRSDDLMAKARARRQFQQLRAAAS